MKLPLILNTISKTLTKKNAKAIVVGGSVRDHFLNMPIKDYDIEVFGLKNIEELEEILKEYGSVNLVGKSFGVIKFSYQDDEYDFSFPRTEKKIDKGHCGFDIKVNGFLNYKEASRRRDFTINAMGYDIEEQNFIDPFNGLEDIKQKTLRHIDDKTFVEDPLRIYRAIQFSARFEYKLAEKSFLLCKDMVQNGLLEELPKERVYEEFKKLLLKSSKPSLGFELMRELKILQYFPELKAIIDVPQSKKWHPEGDVWIHTMISLDKMVALLGSNKKQNLKFMFAILCHDLGKALATTIEKNGKIRAINHEFMGVEPTKKFLYRVTNEHDFITSILPLVEYHLRPSQFYRDGSRDKTIRKLATKVNIEELVVVAKADFLGRTTKESLFGIYYAGDWLLKKAKELKVENRALDNLLQGKDLIDLGLKPSPKFKTILDEVYSLQIDGILNNRAEALKYVIKNINLI